MVIVVLVGVEVLRSEVRHAHLPRQLLHLFRVLGRLADEDALPEETMSNVEFRKLDLLELGLIGRSAGVCECARRDPVDACRSWVVEEEVL